MTTASVSDARPSTLDFSTVRSAEFPWAGQQVYLDAASIGPLPERTRKAVDQFNRKRGRPWEFGHEDMFGLFERSRSLIARLINADTTEIALAPNTSFGLGVAARALPLKRGDKVLVSAREFPANVYPWMRLADRGVELELVPVTAEGWPDEARMLERIEDPKVRAVAVSLVQFASGYTIDVARISEAARRTGTWFVLDAIQGLGHLPFDLRQTPVDILCSGGQKWLLSPWGSGFIYVRKELIGQLDPEITGWMAFQGTDDFSKLTHYNPLLRTDARRFELITLPFQDFAGMNESLTLLLELGIDRIADHLRALHQPVIRWAEARGITVTSPVGAHGSGILCIAPKDPAGAHKALRAAGVICSLREGSLRLAPHCYTAATDFEKVMEVLDGAR
jgi:selenocysteine lyase/cysteine desulfurase